MKEKPIIFSTPMVRAILAGQKTMTRLVVKPQPLSDNPISNGIITKAPYSAGDILWVRETFTDVPNSCEYIYLAESQFDDCGKGDISWNWTPSIFMPRKAARLFLEVKNVRAERLRDISEEDAEAEGCGFEALKKWAKNNCPELEYPYWLSLNDRPEPDSELWNEIDESLSYCRKCAEKEAARLNKKYPGAVFVDGGWTQEDASVTNCEICYKPLDFSAIDECFKYEYEHWAKHGIEKPDGYVLEHMLWMEDSLPEKYPKLRSILFRRLWDSLYAKRGYSWDSNPWVWVIEFERITETA